MGTEPPLANVVKVSGNFLIASVIESLGEAVALTRKYGLDPQTYGDFLTNSLFAAPVFRTYGKPNRKRKIRTSRIQAETRIEGRAARIGGRARG